MPAIYTARVNSVRINVMRDGPGRFVIRWYPVVGGAPVRERFREKDKAVGRADEIAESIARGLSDVLTLSSHDRDSYRTAVQKLAPRGIPLHSAVAEYVAIDAALAPLHIPPRAAIAEYIAARSLLPLGRTLHEAVALLKATQGVTQRPLPPTQELVDELYSSLLTNKMKPRSKQRLREIRAKGDQFAAAFPDLLAATTPAIERYLLTLRTTKGEPIQPKTHDHHLALVRQIYHYAERQGLWPKSIPLPAEHLPRYYRGGVPATVTPETMELILQLSAGHESGYWMPFLLLAAFGGLRPSEIFRLSWDQVRRRDKVIVVPAAIAKKIHTPRLVPISAQLQAWLTPYWQTAGRLYVFTENTMSNQETEFIAWLVEQIPGFHWVPDILRHSAVSYRLAEVMNIPQVAFEFGTSEAMIKRFYNDPKTAAQVRRWRAIRPPKRAKGGKIIPITQVA